jgi:hypothetical protein
VPSIIIIMIKSRTVRWARHVACMEERRGEERRGEERRGEERREEKRRRYAFGGNATRKHH